MRKIETCSYMSSRSKYVYAPTGIRQKSAVQCAGVGMEAMLSDVKVDAILIFPALCFR